MYPLVSEIWNYMLRMQKYYYSTTVTIRDTWYLPSASSTRQSLYSTRQSRLFRVPPSASQTHSLSFARGQTTSILLHSSVSVRPPLLHSSLHCHTGFSDCGWSQWTHSLDAELVVGETCQKDAEIHTQVCSPNWPESFLGWEIA